MSWIWKKKEWEIRVFGKGDGCPGSHTEHECHRDSDVSAARGVPSSNFTLKNLKSRPMGKGVRFGGGIVSFLFRKPEASRELTTEGGGGSKEERRVANGKAQSRCPGPRTEQDSREMRASPRDGEETQESSLQPLPRRGGLCRHKESPLCDKRLIEPHLPYKLFSKVNNSHALMYG